MFHPKVIFILTPLVFVACSLASTINVPQDQPTIQAGINAAKQGDTVLVAPGTYVENINFMGKAITVKSSGGATTTIIDGSSAAPVAAFVSKENANSILRDFTLQNGFASDFPSIGGGVFIRGSSPTIRNNVIRNNYAPSDGGGVGIYFGSPVIVHNKITQNYASLGGGIAVFGKSRSRILSNVIDRNKAGNGGGVELYGAEKVLFENNKIVGNRAGYAGGGFYILYHENDAVIVQNLIAKNRGVSGSQIYILIGPRKSGFALINNTIVSAPNGGADAAVVADGFNKNVVIENNIIYAIGDKSGLLCNPDYLDGPPIVRFNDSFHATSPYTGSCAGLAGSSGNISADPLFVTKSNYQLQPGSPAIDAGSNTAPDLPGKDFAGHARIVGNAVDLGVYENQPQ